MAERESCSTNNTINGFCPRQGTRGPADLKRRTMAAGGRGRNDGRGVFQRFARGATGLIEVQLENIPGSNARLTGAGIASLRLRDRLRCPGYLRGTAMFEGFYKVDYQAGDVAGRSVMHVRGGRMLGGNSAFAHVGSYQTIGDQVVGRVVGQRHFVDHRFRTLYGNDDDEIVMRGHAEGEGWRFEARPVQTPGVVLHSLMTRLDEASLPPAGTVGEGGIVNGLYSLHIRLLDGLDGGLTGVMLLHHGRIFGGDAFYYYLGAYSSAAGRWKGEIVNQEHTPGTSEHPVFRGHEVGIGFSGSCSADGAAWEATALAGKRSLRLAAALTLLHRA